jgi:23S rRNA (guanine2535-N1)-methyltransferase
VTSAKMRLINDTNVGKCLDLAMYIIYTTYRMQYKFATQSTNYEDLSSGRVFYSLPGSPAFPVRLASEIFRRCLARWGEKDRPCVLYDPCCGAAYHLSVIAYLHWISIRQVICSDIDDKAVQLANRNLSLLTLDGLERRVREITTMVRLYGKESHIAALESITRLQEQIGKFPVNFPLQIHAFQANATDVDALGAHLQKASIDIVFTDIPYGQHSQWMGSTSPNPTQAMLSAIRNFISPTGVVAVASDKQQKIFHEGYERLEKFQVGKRQVVFLRPRS